MTPEQENIIASVRDGLTPSGAAQAEGLNRRTVNRWIEAGRREPDGPYGAFAEAIGVAEAERELELVQQLEPHYDKEWMAVARSLEVVNPDWAGEPERPAVQVNVSLDYLLEDTDD